MHNNSFCKEKLIQARLFLDFSLQEVGDMLGVTKQYIQQLESGTKAPTSDNIEKLAQILKVKPKFFIRSITEITLESQCHFRKARTTTVSVKERALQQSNMFEDLVDFIEQELSLPNNNFISVNVTTAETIERVAEKCREVWGLGLDAPIKDMTAVMEKAGAVVTYFSDISEKVDAFSINKRRPIVIRNPAKDGVCRMRFDLAHECGHIVMHNGVITGDVETERQANRFASAFLLPRNAFIREFGFLSYNYRIDWERLKSLKERWKVSLAAIMYRAMDLKLINANKYRTACIYLSNKGFTKNEPLDDILPMERPFILSKSLEMLEKNGSLNFYLEDRGYTESFFEKLSGYKVSKGNVINISCFR